MISEVRNYYEICDFLNKKDLFKVELSVAFSKISVCIYYKFTLCMFSANCIVLLI